MYCCAVCSAAQFSAVLHSAVQCAVLYSVLQCAVQDIGVEWSVKESTCRAQCSRLVYRTCVQDPRGHQDYHLLPPPLGQELPKCLFPGGRAAVQCSAVQCITVQCSAVQWGSVKYNAVQCSAVQYCAMQCSAVQYPLPRQPRPRRCNRPRPRKVLGGAEHQEEKN